MRDGFLKGGEREEKDFASSVAEKARREVEKLIKGMSEIRGDSILYVMRGGSTGGYIAGLLYGMYLYSNATFKENFPKVVKALYKRLSKEYEAISLVLSHDLRIAEPLLWFVTGFLAALKDMEKEAGGDEGGSNPDR